MPARICLQCRCGLVPAGRWCGGWRCYANSGVTIIDNWHNWHVHPCQSCHSCHSILRTGLALSQCRKHRGKQQSQSAGRYTDHPHLAGMQTVFPRWWVSQQLVVWSKLASWKTVVRLLSILNYGSFTLYKYYCIVQIYALNCVNICLAAKLSKGFQQAAPWPQFEL